MASLPCLLFDSDGTLVDSEILLADVLGEVLPQFDLPFTAAQYLKEFRGVRSQLSRPWPCVMRFN
ncbi:hypothetical protein [Litchfieldella xinjiangensis]|uniref:hypothetical protein n=1 Tax=Litchfieldella xinjiangensis TaxID=1166948 RepID=UPI000A7F238F